MNASEFIKEYLGIDIHDKLPDRGNLVYCFAIVNENFGAVLEVVEDTKVRRALHLYKGEEHGELVDDQVVSGGKVVIPDWSKVLKVWLTHEQLDVCQGLNLLQY